MISLSDTKNSRKVSLVKMMEQGFPLTMSLQNMLFSTIWMIRTIRFDGHGLIRTDGKLNLSEHSQELIDVYAVHQFH